MGIISSPEGSGGNRLRLKPIDFMDHDYLSVFLPISCKIDVKVLRNILGTINRRLKLNIVKISEISVPTNIDTIDFYIVIYIC